MKINAKIKAISVKGEDREGNPYTDKWGNEQARVSIQIENAGYENFWLSNFVKHGDYVTTWKSGEEHEIETTKKGDFTNFKAVKASPQTIEKFRAGAGQSYIGGTYAARETLKDLKQDTTNIIDSLEGKLLDDASGAINAILARLVQIEKTQLHIEELLKEIHGQMFPPNPL